MISLLPISKSYLNDTLINKAAISFDVEHGKIYTTIDIVLATLYAKIIKHTNQPKELDKVHREIISSNFNNLDYIKLEDIFNQNNKFFKKESQNILSTIFSSEEIENISFSISNETKVKKNNIITLFIMLLPIVVGTINKVYFNERLDKDGFVNLLDEQTTYLSKITISDELIHELVNRHNLKSLDTKSLNTNFNTSTTIPNLKIIIGIVVIGLIIIASAFHLTRKNKSVKTETKKIEKLKKNSKHTIETNLNYLYYPSKEIVGNYIKDYEFLGYFTDYKLNNKTSILILSNGGEARILDFINSETPITTHYWFPFRRIIADKDKHTLSEKSNNQINNIISILKAYPKVEIKIAGYSYNIKEATKNFEASVRFAKEVTNKFIEGGINKDRIIYEGYGREYPLNIGINLDKRIDIRITKK